MVVTGSYTFMANPQKTYENDAPRKMEYAVLVVNLDHVMITSRSGQSLRLDIEAAQALALVLRDTILVERFK